MIDPEFDPFKDQMPRQQLFYAEISHLATARVEEATNLCKQMLGKIVHVDPVDTLYTPFEFDQRLPSAILGADAIEGDDIYVHTAESVVELWFNLFDDGSPYVHESDLTFFDERNIAVPDYIGYQIFASPEMPPVAVFRAAGDLVEDGINERYQAIPEHLRSIDMSDLPYIDALRQIGYKPHMLDADDCDGVMAAVRQFRVHPRQLMAETYGAHWRDRAPNAAN